MWICGRVWFGSILVRNVGPETERVGGSRSAGSRHVENWRFIDLVKHPKRGERVKETERETIHLALWRGGPWTRDEVDPGP